jgi:pimeloyl-ACP methyl ester carboxylesterase
MSKRRLVTGLAGFVGLIALAGVAFALFVNSTDPPETGEFYVAPSPLPGGPPGTIVRTEEVDDPPPGSRAWKILYLSRSYTGRPTAVSGLLFVPTTPAPEGGRRVVVSTHGTIGVASRCAGSTLGAKYWPAIDGLHEFLRRGYVVVAPDYEGLGTPGPHPYLVGDSEAWAALDAVRAARRFAPARAGTRFAVFGASQGGQAALFTGQQAARYAPELSLVGVAAAAPATDLERLFSSNPDHTFIRVLSAYTLASWSRVYPQLRLDQVVTRPARPVVRRIAGICIAVDRNATIAAALVAQLLRISYLKERPWDIEPWKGPIAENSPGRVRIGAPIMITQGEADRLITPPITRDFVDELCGKGESIIYRTYAGVDHLHAGPETAPDVAEWLADRFAGKPPPSGCQRAQGPVSTGPFARPSASRTIESGTPKPLRPPSETDAAKMVVTTRPDASTIGPPELPERTSPRSDVIDRRTGPRP